MATAEMQEESFPASSDLNLANLVKEATWKDLLFDLVKKNKIDPWNVDLVEVVDKYIETVKSLKVMDLRIPANIILAAAVLLRLKSEMLSFEEAAEDVQDAQETLARPDIYVEGLSVRLRKPLHSRVSLNELIEALDEAMKLKQAKELGRETYVPELQIKINPIDIEAAEERLKGEIARRLDKEKMTTFSYLLKDMGFNDVLLEVFIPLIFLANKGSIALIQEKFFDEIIIRMEDAYG
jgi:segregation and condensation protein A